MNIALYEKLADGQLLKISERPWDEQLIQALDAANYVLVGGKEYEMIEGRLNLDHNVFELASGYGRLMKGEGARQ